jgi:hypothetical protein
VSRSLYVVAQLHRQARAQKIRSLLSIFIT